MRHDRSGERTTLLDMEVIGRPPEPPTAKDRWPDDSSAAHEISPPQPLSDGQHVTERHHGPGRGALDPPFGAVAWIGQHPGKGRGSGSSVRPHRR